MRQIRKHLKQVGNKETQFQLIEMININDKNPSLYTWFLFCCQPQVFCCVLFFFVYLLSVLHIHVSSCKSDSS